MMKYGLALDLVAYVVIVAAVMLLGPVLFERGGRRLPPEPITL